MSNELSGDDVWDHLVLEQGNLVLESQLALLEASNLELVGRGGHAQGLDGRIKVAVLKAKMLKPRLLFGISTVHPVHAP